MKLTQLQSEGETHRYNDYRRYTYKFTRSGCSLKVEHYPDMVKTVDRSHPARPVASELTHCVLLYFKSAYLYTQVRDIRIVYFEFLTESAFFK